MMISQTTISMDRRITQLHHVISSGALVCMEKKFAQFTLLYSEPDEKEFSGKVIVRLLNCHPGFWHNDQLNICVCFDADNFIVLAVVQ